MDSEQLAAATARGDSGAFEEIYRRYREIVARRLSHLVGPRDDAIVADLVQETFVHALRGLPSYRREAPLLHWLLRIATNVGRTHYRRSRRRQLLWWLWPQAEAEGQVPSPGRRVDEAYVELQAVHRALSRLSPRLREAVILFELEGVSLAQMAIQLQVPLHTAASRVRRGRARLRRCLEEAGFVASSRRKERPPERGRLDEPVEERLTADAGQVMAGSRLLASEELRVR